MQNKKNLPIYDIHESNLRNYTTTERDKKRGIDKFPPEDYRNRSEDLLPEEIVEPVLTEPEEMEMGEIMETVAQVK